MLFCSKRLNYRFIFIGPAAFRPRAHTAQSYTPSIEKGRPVLQGLLAIDFLAKEVCEYFSRSDTGQCILKWYVTFLKYQTNLFSWSWLVCYVNYDYLFRYLGGLKQCLNLLVSWSVMSKHCLNDRMRDAGLHTWRHGYFPVYIILYFISTLD